MSNFDLASGLGDILSMALKQTGVEDVSAVKLEDPDSLLNSAADSISTSLLSSDTGSLTQNLISQLSSSSTAPVQSPSLSHSSLQPQATLPSLPAMNSSPFNGTTSMPIKSEPVSNNQCAYTQDGGASSQSPFNQVKMEFSPPFSSSNTHASVSSSSGTFSRQASQVAPQTMDCDFTDIDLDEIFSDEPDTAPVNSQFPPVPTSLPQAPQQIAPPGSNFFNNDPVFYPTNPSAGSSTTGFTTHTPPTFTPPPSTQSQFVPPAPPQTNATSNVGGTFNEFDFNDRDMNSLHSLPKLMDNDLSALLDDLADNDFVSNFPLTDLNFNPSNSGSTFGDLTTSSNPARFPTSNNRGMNGSYEMSRFPPKNGNLQISRGLLSPDNGSLISNASMTLTRPLGSAINAPSQSNAFTMRPATGGYRPALQQQNHFKLSALSRLQQARGGSASPVMMAAAGSGAAQSNKAADEDSDDEDDTFIAADTYANYTPAKLKIGIVHPDPIVESSSLSSVEPPQVWFDLKLPSRVMSEGLLSSLQLEAVVYSCQQHMNILSDGTRAGFLVGDGAGVGKGRTVAGIIYQNYLEGRKKALWLSVSNDLKYDAIRDLRDIGAKNIKVYSLNKFHYGKISGKRNGRVRKGVIFATYSSLIGESSSGGKYRTRFNQIIHWLGSHYEGVIVFDECHKAKNLVPTGASKPSKTGLTVLQLQKKLPKARIVYCSATGASEPRNMAYMSRLGIWGAGTQFPTFQDFIKSVERRGVGAMEIVAMDMKLRGMYIARQLSFSGVTFSIDEVKLEEKFIDAYDASVKLWIEARRLFQEAADMLDYDKKKLKSMWGQFWGAHQRFFKYMCIAAKVPETIKVARKAVEDGKCVVIGLQSTGEARTLEQLEQNDGELSGFISTTKGVLETLIRRHFPTPSSDTMGINWSLIDNDPTLPRSCRKRKRPYRARQRGPLFQEDDPHSSDSDEDSSGSPERSDSAVESSSDGEDSSDGSGSSSSDEGSSGEDSVDHPDYNPFGSDPSEPWLQKKSKKKAKKRKMSPANNNSKKKKKNFSIKAPPTSRGKGCKTKTGFNSKSLKFEPVQSPKDSLLSGKKPQFSSHLVDRRQSIAVAEGITRGVSPVPPPAGSLGRKQSLQVMMGSDGGQSLIDAMSSRFNSGPTMPGAGMSSGTGRDAMVKEMKRDLLSKLERLSPHLPTNTLDELIDGLGGPRKVAEMTGRRGRVVSLPDGSVQYQLRSESDVSIEMLNIAEKQRFMNGEKVFAIISEAASSGISLQADKRVKNHRRRVHITLELPWSADRAIQQFGRTHRSNQVSAPEYIFLISQLSGEQRFASIVAKRLESLGALTHGDRRATESRDLSKYNLDTKAGHSSLEVTLKSVLGLEPPMIKTEEYDQQFFDKCCSAMVGVGLVNRQEHLNGSLALDKDACTMSRFLNRILGLPVLLQNQLFNYFSETLAAVVKQAKRLGKLDEGILDYGAAGELVEIVENDEFIGDAAFSTATTQLHKISVERGMSFSEAVQKLNTDHLPGESFCVSKRVSSDKQTSVLIKAVESTGKRYMVYRPNTGCQARSEKLSAILKKYQKVAIEEAEKWWNAQYNSSETLCNHAYWQGKCRKSTPTNPCEVGCRRRGYYILSGSVLGMWTHIEGVFLRHYGHNHRMQIVRVRVNDKRLVGILVPRPCVVDMKQTLQRVSQQAQGTEENPISIS